jgi:hypothetical protein
VESPADEISEMEAALAASHDEEGMLPPSEAGTGGSESSTGAA